MPANDDKKRPISLIQAVAIIVLLFTGKQTIAHFNEALKSWDYSILEITGAYLFPALMGLTIGMRLDPKYWRGFEYAFVVVYLAGIFARLVGLTEPAISIFVIATCMSIMFVVQIGVLDARERHSVRSAKLDSE